MDHFVSLDKLPPELEFPPDLKDRIRFDADQHRLFFHGFMSKAEFDRLAALSEDWSYRRPLEDLFRQCKPDVPRPKGLRGLVAALTSIGF